MKTTSAFLDELRAKLGATSDYQLRAYFGSHPQVISRYRKQRNTFDDSISIRVADTLGYEREYVLACMHAQRANDAEVKTTWEKIATRAATAAAAVLVSITAAPPSAGAAVVVDNIHYTN